MSKADDNTVFDDLMSSMGVRRMDGPKSVVPKRGAKARKAKGRAPKGAATTKPAPSQRPAAAARPPAKPRPPAADTTARTPAAADASRTPTLTPDDAMRPATPPAAAGAAPAAPADPTAGLRAQVAAQQEQLADLRRQLVQADQARQALAEELGAARGEIAHLAGRPGAEAADDGAPLPLRAALSQRGVLGDDEAGRALAALVGAHLTTRLLDGLATLDPMRARQLLGDRLILAAAEYVGRVPPGRAVVRVPPSRCEVSGGHDLQAVARRFEDACLLNGWRRVVVQGGKAWQHRLLSDGLVDARVAFRLLPAHAQVDADADLDGSGPPQVLVRWHLDQDLPTPPPGATLPPVCVDVRASTLGGMLHDAARALQAVQPG